MSQGCRNAQKLLWQNLSKAGTLVAIFIPRNRADLRQLIDLLQVPTATRDGLVTAGYLGLSPVTSAFLETTSLASEAPAVTQVCAGIVSGVIAAILTQPADTIKTRMQVAFSHPRNHADLWNT